MSKGHWYSMSRQICLNHNHKPSYSELHSAKALNRQDESEWLILGSQCCCGMRCKWRCWRKIPKRDWVPIYPDRVVLFVIIWPLSFSLSLILVVLQTHNHCEPRHWRATQQASLKIFGMEIKIGKVYEVWAQKSSDPEDPRNRLFFLIGRNPNGKWRPDKSI